jgi:hypothetical protein
VSTLEYDRAQILNLHKEWWEANTGMEIPRMRPCFPEGMNYLMFNLNGCPYFGIEEKVELWEYLGARGVDFQALDVRVMRLEVRADMAWLACEAQSDRRSMDDDDYKPIRIRATEVYQRDDGAGEPQWRMWHFHCSFLPDADLKRVGFDDTHTERGLGGNPWGDPLRVVGS